MEIHMISSGIKAMLSLKKKKVGVLRVVQENQGMGKEKVSG
jgi:hypothetical protein